MCVWNMSAHKAQKGGGVQRHSIRQEMGRECCQSTVARSFSPAKNLVFTYFQRNAILICVGRVPRDGMHRYELEKNKFLYYTWGGKNNGKFYCTQL